MKIERGAGRILAGLGLIAVMATVVVACSKGPGRPGGGASAATAQQRMDARVVRVTTVTSRPLEGGLTASGVLISREEAAVGSDLSGYRIARVNVDQGVWVRRGQPLVLLDDSLLRAQIDQAAARAAQSASQSERVAGLDNDGVISKEQIETRRMQARVDAAALNDLRTREAHMVIRAPVSGLVLERNVRPGDIASPGGATPMFRIARDGLIELNAEVPEDAMASVRIGDQVKVTLPDGAEVYGHVRLIDPLVDPQTKLGHVRVLLPVRADLRPGGFGRGTFVTANISALTVPETAVRYDAEGASVVVVGADNRVRHIQVKTGRRAGGWVELLEGPPAGSRVLLAAAAFVLDGDLVRPVDAAAPEPAQAQAGLPPARRAR